MDDLQLVPASEFAPLALVEAFNRGFEGYYLPLTQTIESLGAMIEGNDVSLADSLVAVDAAGAPVGVGLMGVRAPAGWVAGMGIAPAWRGAGHGAMLLSALIARARALGLRELRLEVLEQNEPAHCLYTRLGFVEQRPLLVFSGPLAPSGTRTPAPEQPIVPIEPAAALAQFAALHPVPAPWQRDHASLAHSLARLNGLGMRTGDGALLAAVLYRALPGGFVLLDAGSAAAPAEQRTARIVALLRAMVAEAPDAPVRAVNVAPGDPLGDALNALHCPVILRQREMALELAAGS